jgi:hypothetical protein
MGQPGETWDREFDWLVTWLACAAAVAVDLVVLYWASTMQIWHCEDGYGNLGQSFLLLLALVAVPSTYAAWRCVSHTRREPTRRPGARRLLVAVVAAAFGTVIGVSVLLHTADQLTYSGVC